MSRTKRTPRRKARATKAKEAIANAGGLIFANPKDLRPRDRIKRRAGFRLAILFKPVMRKRLKAKNVRLRDDKDLVELAYKFDKHIRQNLPYVLGEDRFLTPKKNFEDVQNFVDDTVSVAKDFTGIVTRIIKGIVDFFKKIKERKAKGQASKEEENDLKEIESPENERQAEKEKEEEEKEEKAVKGNLFSARNMGIALAVLILAFIAYSKFKK